MSKRPRSGSAGGIHNGPTWPLYAPMYIMKDHLLPAESTGNLRRSDVLMEYNSEGELDGGGRSKRKKKENQDPAFEYGSVVSNDDPDYNSEESSSNSGDSDSDANSDSGSNSPEIYAPPSSRKQKIDASMFRKEMLQSENRKLDILKTLLSTKNGTKNEVKSAQDDSRTAVQHAHPTSTWKSSQRSQNRIKTEKEELFLQEPMVEPPKNKQSSKNSKNRNLFSEESKKDRAFGSPANVSDTVDLTNEDPLESPKSSNRRSNNYGSNSELPNYMELPPSPENSVPCNVSPASSCKDFPCSPDPRRICGDENIERELEEFDELIKDADLRSELKEKARNIRHALEIRSGIVEASNTKSIRRRINENTPPRRTIPRNSRLNPVSSPLGIVDPTEGQSHQRYERDIFASKNFTKSRTETVQKNVSSPTSRSLNQANNNRRILNSLQNNDNDRRFYEKASYNKCSYSPPQSRNDNSVDSVTKISSTDQRSMDPQTDSSDLLWNRDNKFNEGNNISVPSSPKHSDLYPDESRGVIGQTGVTNCTCNNNLTRGIGTKYLDVTDQRCTTKNYEDVYHKPHQTVQRNVISRVIAANFSSSQEVMVPAHHPPANKNNRSIGRHFYPDDGRDTIHPSHTNNHLPPQNLHKGSETLQNARNGCLTTNNNLLQRYSCETDLRDRILPFSIANSTWNANLTQPTVSKSSLPSKHDSANKSSDSAQSRFYPAESKNIISQNRSTDTFGNDNLTRGTGTKNPKIIDQHYATENSRNVYGKSYPTDQGNVVSQAGTADFSSTVDLSTKVMPPTHHTPGKEDSDSLEIYFSSDGCRDTMYACNTIARFPYQEFHKGSETSRNVSHGYPTTNYNLVQRPSEPTDPRDMIFPSVTANLTQPTVSKSSLPSKHDFTNKTSGYVQSRFYPAESKNINSQQRSSDIFCYDNLTRGTGAKYPKIIDQHYATENSRNVYGKSYPSDQGNVVSQAGTADFSWALDLSKKVTPPTHHTPGKEDSDSLETYFSSDGCRDTMYACNTIARFPYQEFHKGSETSRNVSHGYPTTNYSLVQKSSESTDPRDMILPSVTANLAQPTVSKSSLPSKHNFVNKTSGSVQSRFYPAASKNINSQQRSSDTFCDDNLTRGTGAKYPKITDQHTATEKSRDAYGKSYPIDQGSVISQAGTADFPRALDLPQEVTLSTRHALGKQDSDALGTYFYSADWRDTMYPCNTIAQFPYQEFHKGFETSQNANHGYPTTKYSLVQRPSEPTDPRDMILPSVTANSNWNANLTQSTVSKSSPAQSQFYAADPKDMILQNTTGYYSKSEFFYGSEKSLPKFSVVSEQRACSMDSADPQLIPETASFTATYNSATKTTDCALENNAASQNASMIGIINGDTFQGYNDQFTNFAHPDSANYPHQTNRLFHGFQSQSLEISNNNNFDQHTHSPHSSESIVPDSDEELGL